MSDSAINVLIKVSAASMALRNRVLTQVLNRITTIVESLFTIIDRMIHELQNFIGMARHQIARCLKPEHHSLEILQ